MKNKETKHVTFSWDKIKGQNKYTIHIGKNPKKMSPLKKEEIIKKTENSTVAKINPGRYFWKIMG